MSAKISLPEGIETDEMAKRINEFAKRVGTNLLVSVKKTDEYPLTTSYTRVPGLEKGFNSSGGLIIFVSRIAARQTGAGGTLISQLRLDGKSIDVCTETYVNGARDFSWHFLPILVTEGTHKIEIFAKTDGPTTIVNGGSEQESTLHAIEFLGA